MSNTNVTYLVGACCGVLGLGAFISLIVAPAIAAYPRAWQKVAVVFLSGYVLASLVGVGIVLGLLIVVEWPRVF